MSIRQELNSFIKNIDNVSRGYESWGKVSVQRILIRDGENMYSIVPVESISTITEKDLVPLQRNSKEDELPLRIFAQRKKINCILYTRQHNASAIPSHTDLGISPILDDQAQLLGVSVRIANVNHPKIEVHNTVWALKRRFATIQSNGRCICIGGTIDDAYIAAQLLEKTSKAFIEAKYLGGAKSINRLEAWAMQMYYQFKYAKEAKKNR